MRQCVQLAVMLCLLFKQGISSPLSPEDAQHGYYMKGSEIGVRQEVNVSRKGLPPTLHASPITLPCDSFSSIIDNGAVSFNLNSLDKECDHVFIGSKAQRCTVAIMCKGEIDMDPSNCNKGYIKFWDGSIGMMNACGSFSFHDTPRYPRNGGSDVYIKYKGKTNFGSVCTAFCMEDLFEEHYKIAQISKPRRLKKNVHFKKPIIDEGCTCGKISEQSGRIVGGTDIKPFEFPWLAALVLNVKGMERKTLCGAVIVSNRYVLTAAHCIDSNNTRHLKPEDIQVILHAHIMDFFPAAGDNGTESKYHDIPGYDLPIPKDEDEDSLRLNVTKIMMHPLRDDYTNDYDIALLELTDPVDILDEKFTPICLADIGKFFEYPVNSTFTVAGWGNDYENASASSKIVRKVDLYLGKCKAEEWVTTPRHFCVGYLPGGKDTCQGDSGSPLIYKFRPETNQYMLSGIVSSGIGCARADLLGFYTNVQELLQWFYFTIDAPDNKFCSV